MPAHPGTGLEAHEAVRLGRGRVHHLPDVDAHAIGEHRQFVDEGDVHRAEDVLQQLRQLRGLGARDPHDVIAHELVHRRRALEAGVGQASDDLGRVAQREIGTPGIDALGREGEVEVTTCGQTRLLEQRSDALAGRAGVGGGLEHDQLVGLQHLGKRTHAVQ